MIAVLRAGPLASVQDLGRPGLLRQGICASGAMDPPALRVGNRLICNDEGAAAIEIAFPIAVRFETAAAFAVAGAAADVRLGDRRLPSDFAAQAAAGEVLEIAPLGRGVFAYLCLQGGLDVPVRLGARATDLKSGFGGFEGRALQAGDRLSTLPRVTPPRLPPSGLGVSPSWRFGAGEGHADPLRFVPAAEWDDFGEAAQGAFLQGPWRVSRTVNRQGYRIEGPVLAPARRRELFSHGLVPGVIQVPPDGFPIVQMAEANTCGGYPKLGVIIAADLPRLAQSRSGTPLAFAPVGRQEGLAAAARIEARLRTVAVALDLMRDPAAIKETA